MAAALTGCAADLSQELDDAESGGSEGGDQVQSDDDGTFVHTVVDATDAMAWIWFDLETKSQVQPSMPLDSDEWDLGFQRYNIAINGGSSGGGGMEAVVLEGVTLESVTALPDGPWLVDQPDDDDQDDDPEYALADWYDYDFMTHVLSPRVVVYGIRSVDGNEFALEVLDYYDEAGSSGWMQIRWRAL